MSKRILFIGGSPCSGKSTVAQRLHRAMGGYYFKVDDYLDDFIARGAERGYPACKNSTAMTPDETWLREPSVQCREEFRIYEEISEFVFEALDRLDSDFIITEGAAYTPRVMEGRRDARYITIVPTADFQVSHYKEREWVPYVLQGCSDKQQAFRNWMERDILFAREVKAACESRGVPTIVNDGTISPDEMLRRVQALFRL